ncbi:MAG: DUF4923 family protein [Bacteroides sp.]|nr:DUF4923 family protein [Bacteroides sp.]
MKVKSILLALALFGGASVANAQNVGDLLKGLGGNSDITSTISNVIEGVFTKSDLTLEDLVGQYESTGPAVTFKSDNFLQKAGGLAGAAALETKLQPYYEQYGLTGMPLSIDKDANFTLSVMKVKLSGTIEQGDEGTFKFNLMVGGKMKVGTFTAYVEKSGKNLNLMFDASKLKDIISTVGKFSGVNIAKTLSSLLDSYDGACVGFKMEYKGEPQADSTESSVSTSVDEDQQKDKVEDGINALKGLLNKKKK